MVEEFLSARRTLTKEDGRTPLLSESTLNKDLRVLKAAFNCGIRRGYLRSNPCKDIKPKRIPKKDIRVLNDEELDSLLNACPSVRWQGFLLVQARSGLRVGEAEYLEWRDIYWNEHIIQVTNKVEHTVKDKEPRDVPLYPDTERTLLRMHEEARVGSHYVFENKLGRPWLNNLRREFSKLVRKAGIAKCTFHDLRRTAITGWDREGWDIATVKQAAGHSSIATTERYYMKASEKAIRNAWKNASRAKSEAKNGTYSEHAVTSPDMDNPITGVTPSTSIS